MMNCSLCKFSKPNITPQGVDLRCRRYPPTSLLIPAPQGVAIASDFPATKAENCCSEFSSRLATETKQ